MQTPTFISKLSDGNVIFRLDVGKKPYTPECGKGKTKIDLFWDFLQKWPMSKL
jgi:hypothetical protein